MSQDQTSLARVASSSGFGVGGVTELVSPLLHLVGFCEDAVHGAGRAQVGALIEQGNVRCGGRHVKETWDRMGARDREQEVRRAQG